MLFWIAKFHKEALKCYASTFTPPTFLQSPHDIHKYIRV